MENHYHDEQEIRAVVTGFEECTTGKADFTHVSHLTVATYYLCRLTPDESFEKMRSGLFRFLDHRGIDRTKYKEQLTRDWITLVHGVVAQMGPDTSVVDVTNEVIQKYGKLRLPEAANGETQ